MASNSIKINAVGRNGSAFSSAQDIVVPSLYATVTSETQGVAGALCTVTIVKGPAGNFYCNYQVTDTMDAVLAMLNEDTVADLDVVSALTVGTDIHFVKELDHTIDVNASTTAATVGGAITVKGGTGSTSGAGGAVNITGGTAGATAASVGGAVNITSGVSGAGNGASGALNLKSGAATAANTGVVTLASGVPATSGNSGNIAIATGAATTGNSGNIGNITGAAVTGNSGTNQLATGATTTGDSGAITISTGNAGTGASGNITLSPGTASTTVGKIVMSNAVVEKHKTAAINATATATAKELATGYITSTSAAATTITLPTGTALGSELGAAQGTVFKFYVDNVSGANTVTIAVSTNGILSANAAANAATFGLLTVPSGVTGLAEFTCIFSSATAFAFSRTA